MQNHPTRRGFLKSCLLGLPFIVAGRGLLAATAKVPSPPVDLGFLETAVSLQRRDTWTDFEPRTWIMKVETFFDRITVHHGGGINNHKEKDAIIGDIQSVSISHLEKDFGDIAYHFVVDAAGRAWEGRSLAYEGAHVSGQNEHNVGIMLLGNFDDQIATNEQKACLSNLIAAFRLQYGIKQHRIYGHRDLGQSSCPGRNLYEYIVNLRQTGEKTAGEGEHDIGIKNKG